jgi:MoxR-like ATPase
MTTSTLQDKFVAVRNEMNEELVEREVETDLVVRMLLGRVHGVFLGPWGVGKSMLIRKMVERVDAKLFETLLVKNSPAEQVVGPVSLKALENDEFKRITTGKLPEANVAFIDEVFKSNATVLNNMLSIINERVFHNNGSPTPLPNFWTVYSASNELPVEQREELGAFYDRLAVRVVVEPVRSSENMVEVFKQQLARNRGEQIASAVTKVSFDEVVQAQSEVAQVEVSEQTMNGLTNLYAKLRKEGMDVSIRRLGEGLKLMQAAAWLRGATTTTIEDLRVMEHIIWDDPDEERKLAHELTIEYAGSVARKAQQIRAEYEELANELEPHIQTIVEATKAKESGEGDLVDDREALNEGFRIVHTLKVVHDRCEKEIKEAKDQGLDSTELEGLLAQINDTRQVMSRDVLGIE